MFEVISARGDMTRVKAQDFILHDGTYQFYILIEALPGEYERQFVAWFPYMNVFYIKRVGCIKKEETIQ